MADNKTETQKLEAETQNLKIVGKKPKLTFRHLKSCTQCLLKLLTRPNYEEIKKWYLILEDIKKEWRLALNKRYWGQFINHIYKIIITNKSDLALHNIKLKINECECLKIDNSKFLITKTLFVRKLEEIYLKKGQLYWDFLYSILEYRISQNGAKDAIIINKYANIKQKLILYHVIFKYLLYGNYDEFLTIYEDFGDQFKDLYIDGRNIIDQLFLRKKFENINYTFSNIKNVINILTKDNVKFNSEFALRKIFVHYFPCADLNIPCLLDLVEFILNFGIDLNQFLVKTNFFKYCPYTHKHIIIFLLKIKTQKFDINLKMGDSSIILLSYKPVSSWVAAWLTIDDLKLYMDSGLDINTSDKDGETLLLYMAEKKNIPVIKFLLENGAQITPKVKEYVSLNKDEVRQIIENHQELPPY